MEMLILLIKILMYVINPFCLVPLVLFLNFSLHVIFMIIFQVLELGHEHIVIPMQALD